MQIIVNQLIEWVLEVMIGYYSILNSFFFIDILFIGKFPWDPQLKKNIELQLCVHLLRADYSPTEIWSQGLVVRHQRN